MWVGPFILMGELRHGRKMLMMPMYKTSPVANYKWFRQSSCCTNGKFAQIVEIMSISHMMQYINCSLHTLTLKCMPGRIICHLKLAVIPTPFIQPKHFNSLIFIVIYNYEACVVTDQAKQRKYAQLSVNHHFRPFPVGLLVHFDWTHCLSWQTLQHESDQRQGGHIHSSTFKGLLW